MNVTAVAIVAILAGSLVSLIKYLRQTTSSDQVKSLETEVDRLRERVQVLEEIVTDNKYTLNKEFENLKKTG
ncbi:hypothetical protein CWI84_09035 [Idiomarina tyrosinivorans]|uniref:Nitrite reductase n=1 Tax=Idiomarina tyrosinivorans TaxID=1445662 RepID=A0A432ZPE9_9GAMM|nr:hypothetical protein [Idiomarina tyrosinivorans]RUO79767.1 hypothetical protein CWI84_09035 [Idiomarina tyrosinivorans]